MRGDANDDNGIDIADAVKILGHLFGGTGPLLCMDTGDANDDGAVNIADAVYVLNYMFGGGPPPPPPFAAAGTCGADPTPDPIRCGAYPPCD